MAIQRALAVYAVCVSVVCQVGESQFTPSGYETFFCAWRCGLGLPSGCFTGSSCFQQPGFDCEQEGKERFTSMEVCQKYRGTKPVCNDGDCAGAKIFQVAYDLSVGIKNDYERHAWASLSASVSKDAVFIGLGSELFSGEKDLPDLLKSFHNRTNGSSIDLSPKKVTTVEYDRPNLKGQAIHEMVEVSYGGGSTTTIYARWHWLQFRNSGRWLLDTALAPAAAFQSAGFNNQDQMTQLIQQRAAFQSAGFNNQDQMTQLIQQRGARFSQLYNAGLADEIAKEMWMPGTTLFSDMSRQFSTDDSLKDFVSRRSLGEYIEISTTNVTVMPSGKVAHELGLVTALGGIPVKYYARWVYGVQEQGDRQPSFRIETQLFFADATMKPLLLI